MLIKRPADIPSSEITDKKHYLNRREFIRAATGTAAVAAAGAIGAEALLHAQPPAPHKAKLENVKPSEFSTTEKPNTWEQITTYNNYYEFGTDKDVAVATTQDVSNRRRGRSRSTASAPSQRSGTSRTSSRARRSRSAIYRHRCVEAWSMVIPWVGFPLADFIKQVRADVEGEVRRVHDAGYDSDADAGHARSPVCAGRTSKGCAWTRRCIR